MPWKPASYPPVFQSGSVPELPDWFLFADISDVSRAATAAGVCPCRSFFPGLQLHFLFFFHRECWSDESVPGSTTSSPILISSSSRSSSSEESTLTSSSLPNPPNLWVPACTLASSMCEHSLDSGVYRPLGVSVFRFVGEDRCNPVSIL